MMDEFNEPEMGYFHAWMPKYEILVKEMGTVILNSPFKKDMEEEFGSILIQNMEVGQLLSSEAVVDDMVKEAELANLYSKTVAGASVEFRGEMCSTYGLLKHMQSTDGRKRSRPGHVCLRGSHRRSTRSMTVWYSSEPEWHRSWALRASSPWDIINAADTITTQRI